LPIRPCGPEFFGVTGQQKLDGVHNLAISRFSPSLRALTTFTATRRVGSWIKKNLRWGKYPIAPARFPGLSLGREKARPKWKIIPNSKTERKTMSVGTILLILLILMLVGAFPTWPHSKNWGYYPSGGLGLVVVILLVLLLLGRI
jgi:hypothetical protein